MFSFERTPSPHLYITVILKSLNICTPYTVRDKEAFKILQPHRKLRIICYKLTNYVESINVADKTYIILLFFYFDLHSALYRN